MSVGLSRRICQRWVYRYNEIGLEGLSDRQGREPKPLLTPEQQEQVCQRLEAGPRPEDQVCSLRGVDMQRILANEFGVICCLSSVYQFLHQLLSQHEWWLVDLARKLGMSHQKLRDWLHARQTPIRRPCRLCLVERYGRLAATGNSWAVSWRLPQSAAKRFQHSSGLV